MSKLNVQLIQLMAYAGLSRRARDPLPRFSQGFRVAAQHQDVALTEDGVAVGDDDLALTAAPHTKNEGLPW